MSLFLQFPIGYSLIVINCKWISDFVYNLIRVVENSLYSSIFDDEYCLMTSAKLTLVSSVVEIELKIKYNSLSKGSILRMSSRSEDN